MPVPAVERSEQRHVPPSRLPRHSAADATPRRATVVPTVLLSSMALAFGGLAVLPSGGTGALRVTAAAATAPFVIDAPAGVAGVPTEADYDTLYGIPDNPPLVVRKPGAPAPAAERAAASATGAAPSAAREPARASRSRRPVAAPLPKRAFVRPSSGRLTSSYKWRWGRMHTGIDLAGPYGSPIRAVAAGKVIESGRESGYGNIVKLQHDDGSVTYYAHNSRLLVSAGERVSAGEVIAKEGSTGHSTGPHLHFEVRIGGNPVNPIPWLRKRGISI